MFLTDIYGRAVWFVVFVTAVTGAAAVTHSNGSINTIYGIIPTLNLYIVSPILYIYFWHTCHICHM